MRRWALAPAACAASGAALSLAFPEPDLAPLAWIALAPLLGMARGTVRRGAGLAFAFGLGFFGSLLIWIHLVGWVAWIVLVILQAAFIALFGASWALASRTRSAALRVIAAAALWVAAEYLRSRVPVGGFTWGQLAQSQHNLDWMLRPASLAGGWLVAAIAVTANACIVEAVRAVRVVRKPLAPVPALVAAAVAITAPLVIPARSAEGESVRVAIVQGNVPRNFAGGVFERDVGIARSHARLTEDLAGRGVDFVVWPESSVGIDLVRVSEVGDIVFDAAEAVGAPMIVGGNLETGDDQNRYKVVAMHVSPEAGIVDVYQKTHLVPFGEYIPARRFLEWIPMLDQIARDAAPASDHTVFRIAGGTVAPVISFEGDFGSLVRRPIAAGGRLLVVATNTSTWGESWASAQHVAFSQVRAVENGVWVAHGALSGISAFIAPDGTVVDGLGLWTAGSLVADVRFATGETFYTRTGDWFPLGCVGVSILAVAISARKRGPRPA